VADRIIVCPTCLEKIDTRIKSISQDKLLLVEGEEDERFFDAIMRSIGISNVQIIVIGGKNKCLTIERLRGLKNDPQFGKVNSLGYIRDADENAADTFESMKNILKASGLPIPTQVLSPSLGHPVIRVMVVPPNRPKGNLEDLCLKAVKGKPVYTCVTKYFKCLKQINIKPRDTKLSKARTRVYIASQDLPGLSLGMAAQKGYWPFKSKVFNEIKRFLRNL